MTMLGWLEQLFCRDLPLGVGFLGSAMPRFLATRGVVMGLGLILAGSVIATHAAEERPERTYLHKDWQIQSSCDAKAAGGQISSVGFDAKGWHKSDIPATVVGALVSD
jgi:hypothetical protein